MKKILILASNPRNDLKLTREIKDLKGVIKRSKNQSQFETEFELEVHPEELQDLLLEHEPRIVHFCGHGTGEQGLVLQNQAGQEQIVSTEALSNLFKLFDKKVEGVILNACYSEVQADAIVRHINYVVGMSHEIRDDAAISFATGFYRALGWGKSIEESYKFGRNAIQIQLAKANTSRSRSSGESRKLLAVDVAEQVIIPEDLKPVLKKKSPLTPFLEKITSALLDDAPDSSIQQSNFPPELLEALKEEEHYKGYRERTRDTWDEFGQTSVTRQDLTRNEYRQRKTLLSKVKDFWIEGFLKPSLYGHNAINLDWKNSSDAVLRPFEVAEDIPVELDESFDQLQTTDIINQTGFGKTLLILGEPGSGKTIALLQLAKKLIQQTEQDLTKPIPVVFNLSSWGQKQQPIEKWLIEELKDKYQVPQRWSEPWIEQQQLILLLDGLDEVQAEKRDACVRALNEFIAAHNVTEMVVCSRVKDYEALTERLQLSSAICIKPLSQEKLYEFLDRAGASLASLKTLLQQDRELEKFAQTPLILNIMSVAYQDWSIKDLLREFLSPENRYRHLFDSYIERMLSRRVIGKKEPKKNSPQYPQKKVVHWLSWLASTMVEESKIIFLIEKMQPTLLDSQSERISYRIRNFLLGFLIFGLMLLIFNLIDGPKLIEELMSGLIGGLTGGVIVGISKEITLFEQMSWSWQRSKSRIIRELLLGLIVGPIVGLIFGLINNNVSINVLIFGLILMLMFGLSSGLVSLEVKQRTVPNQGIRSSAKNAVTLGLIVGPIVGLIVGLIVGPIAGLFVELIDGPIVGLIVGLVFGLVFGLFAGLFVGFRYGGSTCIQHFNLRRILYRKGRIPWNYARFLDYATEHLLMKKVGGGYVFYHRMLMEHFAQKNQVAKVPIPVTPRQTYQPVAQANTKTNIRSSNISNPVPQPSNSIQNHIVCSNCDHQNRTNAKFCSKCGKKLVKPSERLSGKFDHHIKLYFKSLFKTWRAMRVI